MTMTMTNGRIVILKGMMTALLLSVAVPLSTGAQEWAVDRAEKLEREARTLADQRSEWAYAARLYRGAAELRPVGGPDAVVALRMSGMLAYYTGDSKQAAGDLEAAARRAMEGGDLLTAGQILLDAAWVAQKRGDRRAVGRLADRAQKVVDHPVLSQPVRGQVLSRIEGPGAGGSVVAIRPSAVFDLAPSP